MDNRNHLALNACDLAAITAILAFGIGVQVGMIRRANGNPDV
jgi:hypothetical protein